ncbi:MAG TPA: hypothetical protein PKK23_15435 [Nitrospirales bacterium]|nr:hypothetical protein [Nitrospirales bacterium]
MINLIFNPAKPPADIEVNVRSVVRPPTWRKEPYTLSYVLVNREVTAEELIVLLRWAAASKMPNPRVITPELVKWSSLFHPRFFISVNTDCPTFVEPLEWIDGSLPTGFHALSRLWLQSVLFLAGVTLSAAIVQHRFSSGTIGSKLDRLWDAGTLSTSGAAMELTPLGLHDRVSTLAVDSSNEVTRLLALREIFMEAWELIAPKTGIVEVMRKSCPPSNTDGRFEFIEGLLKKLGHRLQAVVVYGSSVSGNQFADIDAVVIVDDPKSALLQLAGTSPTWQGKELNLGIYSPSEFLVMQRLSGDNLLDYGVCIWGEVEVVRKPVPELLARNFSFGVVRQRQQFGMLSREIAAAEMMGPDRRNLYEYFVKIPANVAKGTFGVVGKRLPKEHVHDWLLSTIGFNTPESQSQVTSGNELRALASSAIATGRALLALNTNLCVVRGYDGIDNKERRLVD